jgi:hypothetical protein
MSLVRHGGASCSLSPEEFCCRHSRASDYSTTASQHFISRNTTITFIHPAQLHGIICAIPRHVRCYYKSKQTRVLHYADYQVVSLIAFILSWRPVSLDEENRRFERGH